MFGLHGVLGPSLKLQRHKQLEQILGVLTAVITAAAAAPAAAVATNASRH